MSDPHQEFVGKNVLIKVRWVRWLGASTTGGHSKWLPWIEQDGTTVVRSSYLITAVGFIMLHHAVG